MPATIPAHVIAWRDRRCVVRDVARGLLALACVAIFGEARAATDDVARSLPLVRRVGEAWRWREIDRAGVPPRFVSACPLPDGELALVDTDGLWHYDGLAWNQESSWTLLANVPVDAVVTSPHGLLVARADGVFLLPHDDAASSDEAEAPTDLGRRPRAAASSNPLRAFQIGEPASSPPALLHPWKTPDGRILTALGDSIVEVFPDGELRTIAPPAGSQRVSLVAEDSKGRLLCGTESGLFVLRDDAWSPLPATTCVHAARPTVALRRGHELLVVPDEFDAGHGVLVWDGSTLSALPAPPLSGRVVDAIVLGDDVLVVVMHRGELLVFEDGAWEQAEIPAPFERTFVSLAAARDGRLALIDRSGHVRLCDLASRRWKVHDPATTPVDTADAPRIDGAVNALATRSTGGLWVGTHHGIARWDGRAFVDVHLEAGDTGVALEGVTTVHEDERGHLWVGSGGTFPGALEYDGVRWTHHVEPDGIGEFMVHRIRPAPDGSLWFLLVSGDPDDWNDGGIARWADGTWSRIDPPGADGDRTYDVIFTDDGDALVASLEGVHRITDGRWRELGPTHRRDTSFALHMTRDGTLYRGRGVDLRGVQRYDAGRDVWVQDEGDAWGLVGAGAFAEDALGRVWCSSAYGLATLHRESCTAISTAGVLAAPSFWPVVTDDDGTLFVGSAGSGLLEYVDDDREPPHTESLARRTVEGRDDLVVVSWLGADAFHVTPRDELLYRVRVDDGPWSPTTSDTERAWALRPGAHTVTLETIDRAGNVEPDPRSLSVVVPAPFWRQPPVLIGLAAIGASLAGLALVLVRRARERREAARVEAELSQRLRRLSRHLMRDREDEKRNLSRDLTDDLGQVLTAANLHLGRFDGDPPPGSGESLRAARDAVSCALERVRRLASDVRPSLIDDLGIDVAVRASVDAFADETGLPVQLEIDLGAADLPRPVSDHLYRILQECLSNVRRHARAGEVQVGFRASDDGFLLEVRDDGVGFATTSQPPGLGLEEARERAADAGGVLTIRSDPGHGTVVRVSIPVHPKGIV